MFALHQIICAVIGYCFGMIETGLIYGKITGVDLRKKGSGNTGATNTLRVAGKKAGAIVLCGDMVKCGIPCLIAWLLFRSYGADVKIIMFAAALGAVLGHNFPCYLHFKGGKGVACTAMLALVIDWPVALIAAAIFFTIAFTTGYVSLSSITAIFLLYVGLLIRCFVMHTYGMSDIANIEFVIFGFIMFALTVFQHRANIKRLMNGTENKFGSKKKN